MGVTTRQSNATAHPGRILLKNQQTRRTQQQVQEAKARAKAAKNQEELRRLAIPGDIAQLEDELEMEEQARREHSMRPDLCGAQPTNRTSPSDESSDDDPSDDALHSELQPDDPLSESLEMSDADPPNLYGPADSGVHGFNDEDEGEWENIDPRLRPVNLKRRHGKEKRGALRAEVTSLRRSHGDPSLTSQRKRPMPPGPDDTVAPKRLKRANAIVGGLDHRWREKVKHGSVRRPQYRRGAMSPFNQGDNDSIGNGDDGPSGAFDGDEPDDLLTHVQGSKSSVPTTNRTSGILPNPQARVGLERGATPVARSTEQMGIRLQPAPVRLSDSTNTGRTTGNSSTTSAMGNLNMSGDTVRMPKSVRHSRNARKPRFTISDLPFPRGGRHVQNWKKTFLPLLLAWAGAHEDPFGLNGELYDVVTDIWARVFPSVTLEENDIVILVKVCENAVNNWRCDIGKCGYSSVSDLVTSVSTQEGRQTFVAKELHKLNYIYKYQDLRVLRGAFRSAVVSKVYSLHLQKLTSITNHYDPQIGAMALAAATVERGLTLFEAGEDTKAE